MSNIFEALREAMRKQAVTDPCEFMDDLGLYPIMCECLEPCFDENEDGDVALTIAPDDACPACSGRGIVFLVLDPEDEKGSQSEFEVTPSN